MASCGLVYDLYEYPMSTLGQIAYFYKIKRSGKKKRQIIKEIFDKSGGQWTNIMAKEKSTLSGGARKYPVPDLIKRKSNLDSRQRAINRKVKKARKAEGKGRKKGSKKKGSKKKSKSKSRSRSRLKAKLKAPSTRPVNKPKSVSLKKKKKRKLVKKKAKSI